MLHAVAARPRQVVGQERVGVVLVLRELAEDGHRLADDALDVLGKRIGVGVGAVVVQRNAERRCAAGSRQARARVNVRSVCALNSVGLSIR